MCALVSSCCSSKPWLVQATHNLVTRLDHLYREDQSLPPPDTVSHEDT